MILEEFPWIQHFNSTCFSWLKDCLTILFITHTAPGSYFLPGEQRVQLAVEVCWFCPSIKALYYKSLVDPSFLPSIRSHGNTLLKDSLLNSRLICSSGNWGQPETTTEAGLRYPAKKLPSWMPQWHVKECYMPLVPKLAVARSLCQPIPLLFTHADPGCG